MNTKSVLPNPGAVVWMKNGDHPHDYLKTIRYQSRTFSPFYQSKHGWSGQVVRRFSRDTGDHLDCPLCGRPYADHGYIRRHILSDCSDNKTQPDSHPYYNGMVCPGDQILTVKNIADETLYKHSHHKSAMLHVSDAITAWRWYRHTDGPANKDVRNPSLYEVVTFPENANQEDAICGICSHPMRDHGQLLHPSVKGDAIVCPGNWIFRCGHTGYRAGILSVV